VRRHAAATHASPQKRSTRQRAQRFCEPVGVRAASATAPPGSQAVLLRLDAI
jgi:hypothetical protein